MDVRTFGSSKVQRDDFLGAAAALGTLSADAAEGCRTTETLCRAMTDAALNRHNALEKAQDRSNLLLDIGLAADAHGPRSRDVRQPRYVDAELLSGNMLIEVFRNVPEIDEGDDDISDPAASALLRRAFGLPIDRRTDTLPQSRQPAGCALCEKECISSFGKLDADREPCRKPRNALDDRGDHALACLMMGGASFARHQAICNAIKRIAHVAGCEATLEPTAFNRVCETRNTARRPGDVTICPLDERGTVIAVDVTVRCTRACGGAAKAEAAKTKKYANIFRDRKATTFYPFALTVEGEGGTAARQLCQLMAQKIAASRTNALNQVGAWRYIVARIANSFAKGVGEQIVLYEHAVARASHAAASLHARGFAGRRPQQLQMVNMIDGKIVYGL